MKIETEFYFFNFKNLNFLIKKKCILTNLCIVPLFVREVKEFFTSPRSFGRNNMSYQPVNGEIDNDDE